MIDLYKTRKLEELHEGRKGQPYLDTKQKWTIGIGHCLTDNPLSDRMIDFIFSEDLAVVQASLRSHLQLFDELDPVRQLVLVDICFNCGIFGLLKFQKMLAALEESDFATAGDEIDNSDLAPGRAARLAMMMKSGEYPEEIT